MSESHWTEERVELLLKLWADGLTGMEVGERMGLTRNQVLGKLSRLNALADGSRTTHPTSLRNRLLRPPKAVRVPVAQGEKAGRSLPPILAAPPIPSSPKRRRSRWKGLAGEIDTIRPAECRWLLGESYEPPTRFCRAPTGHRDLSYCKYHYYAAHKKPNEPKDWVEDNPKRIKGDYRQWKPLDRGT